MKPKDRDFVETVEGHLFCVVGYLHPPDGYTAYLKYVTAPLGKWGRGTTRYSRALPFYHVAQVENTYEYLRRNLPQYLIDCPVRGFTVSWVPRASVKKYFWAQRGLREIRSRGARDSLEERLLGLADLLSEVAGVKELGVTGSLLTGIHNPDFSDMDLTVYGRKTSERLRDAVVRLKEEDGRIQPPSPEEVEAWCRERTGKFPLTINELRRVAESRWSYGYYEGTYFSVHPTRTDKEITEGYGDNTYRRLGEVRGTATVVDAGESIYLPATYIVEDAEIDGRGAEVTRLVSYEGLYGGVFKEGDRVEFRGVLEEVRGRAPLNQVVVGGAGSPSGYIKWV
ncbi:MAG TPA: nucleotidyltransferase domain-containing protein [Candidatus Desulfaltia sp.]|nr:nucleotidyltransferase domain-containing protein [Candidatus Desulfaltia sp.]